MSISPIRFITSVYGKKYGGMLLSLLYSIQTSNPNATVTVFWHDVSPNIRILEKVFTQYEFIDVGVGHHSNLVDNIAEKAPLWAKAAHYYPDERIVLLDTDMLVIKDITHFFDEEFDIGFTYKHAEIYPINTGVILAHTTPPTLEFLDAWAQRTTEINNDPKLREQATTRAFPFGAPDQMAWWNMISFEKGTNKYKISIKNTELTIRGFSCQELNETNSCPITDITHIIHYKGGWHSILIDGTGFTSKRSREDSWEMYLLYLQTYKDALWYAAQSLPFRKLPKHMGITTPFYFDANLNEISFLYKLFLYKERAAVPIRNWVATIKQQLYKRKRWFKSS